MRLGNQFREVKITKEIFDYYKPTFEIDFHKKGKIFYVKYDYEHPHLPQNYKEMWNLKRKSTKTYNQFMNVVHQYCEDNGFWLEYVENETGWSKYNTYHYDVLIPKNLGSNYMIYEWNRHPMECYGNRHYKKYIKDNNGECPLPFPKDVKWWEE